jgi:phosphoglycerate dehydrogenase-like enzyme
MKAIQTVLHPSLPPGVAALLRTVPGLALHEPRDDDGVAEALSAGAEVLVTHTWRADFLTPSLRWIAGTGAGFEQYPLEQLAERGVIVTTAWGVHAGTVAEHAFALLLALTRGVGKAARAMTRNSWEHYLGEELAGRKMAIIGLGRIGEAVALRAQNWEMNIAGIKRHPESYDGCVRDVRGTDRLRETCAWADILILTAPARADGSPLIGREELALLGAGWIVNVARGSVIDEAALIDALTTGALRGAGLDVTAKEPLPADSPLWGLPNVVITPHVGGGSPGYAPRWGAIFVENLAAFRDGGEWRNRLEMAV